MKILRVIQHLAPKVVETTKLKICISHCKVVSECLECQISAVVRRSQAAPSICRSVGHTGCSDTAIAAADPPLPQSSHLQPAVTTPCWCCYSGSSGGFGGSSTTSVIYLDLSEY